MNAVAHSTFAFQEQLPLPIEPEKFNQILAFTSPNGHNVRVNAWSSSWYKKLQTRFNEITSLPLGWDGYGGRPVSFTCAAFAAKLLERISIDGISEPALVPGGDGTLQIEWHRNKYDIEIDILGANRVKAMRYDHSTSKEEIIELDVDFTILKNWIADMATVRI